MIDKDKLHIQCRELLRAYNKGLLGYSQMPEDTNPGFKDVEKEKRIIYFTLPMALNYQRDSYKLWASAKETYLDPQTTEVFDISKSANLPMENLRSKLTKHKLALQPNKHVNTWQIISSTVNDNWKTFENMLCSVDYDFLKLKTLVQDRFKKGFPYLSGPKIFNYWSFIVMEYGNVPLKSAEYIEIAPDTHITKSSVILNVVNENELEKITKDEISKRWRDALEGSGILPIQMHPPLWFWSRNKFQYRLDSL